MSTGPPPSDDQPREQPPDLTLVERGDAIRRRLRKLRGALNRQLIEVFRLRKQREASGDSDEQPPAQD
jgi:hypothetical protein